MVTLLRFSIPLVAILNWCTPVSGGWIKDTPPVVIISAAGEKTSPKSNFIKNLVSFTSRQLNDAQVQHTIILDRKLTAASLINARLVLLPCNPSLPSNARQPLLDFIKSGGKAIVMYCEDKPLSSAMGIQLGNYRKVPPSEQWSALTTSSGVPIPEGMPARIQQYTAQLIAAQPYHPESYVLACWTRDNGESAEPAILRTPHGYWITYSLLPGDDEAKKRLLLSLLSDSIPQVWREAASSLVNKPLGSYSSFNQALNELTLGKRSLSLFRQSPHGAPHLIASVQAANQKWRSLRKHGDFNSYLAAHSLRMALTELYASASANNLPPIMRQGIWISATHVSSWHEKIAHLGNLGFNTLFIDVGTPLQLNASIDTQGPPLSGQPRKHAWLKCIPVESLDKSLQESLQRENRLQMTESGETLPYLCPANPTNQDLVLQAITQLASTNVDAVHLDYIRYARSDACFCPYCRKHSGKTKAGRIQWRSDQIKQLISRARDITRQHGKGLSAAVYSAFPDCIRTVGQDWPAWIKEDLVDFVCPMNYTENIKEFTALLDSQSSSSDPSRICPGLGVNSSQARLSADAVIQQITEVRSRGFSGVSIFDYTPWVEKTVLKPINPMLIPPTKGARQ
jgi:hypothetical protein